MVQVIDGVLHSLLGEMTDLKSLWIISLPVVTVQGVTIVKVSLKKYSINQKILGKKEE